MTAIPSQADGSRRRRPRAVARVAVPASYVVTVAIWVEGSVSQADSSGLVVAMAFTDLLLALIGLVAAVRGRVWVTFVLALGAALLAAGTTFVAGLEFDYTGP